MEVFMKKKVLKIFFIAFVIWILFFMTDFLLSQFKKGPIFSIPITNYWDGGTAEYYGIFYKIIKYKDVYGNVKNIKFGLWGLEIKN